MNITDELERLGKLRKEGRLSGQEFELAKSSLLQQANAAFGTRGGFKESDLPGATARPAPSIWFILGVIMLVSSLIALCVFCLHMR